MLICGTNLPIIITFDEDASALQELSVVLFPRATPTQEIKSWRLQDCILDGNKVYCPIKQTDLMANTLGITADLNVGIEIKWLGANDTEYNIATVWDYILYRKDTTILSGGGIIPSGTKEINILQNGTITENVRTYESVEINVNVPNLIEITMSDCTFTDDGDGNIVITEG